MKIIQQGRTQIGWAKEYTCTGKGNKEGGCGGLLLVEQADLFHTSKHSYGDASSEYFIGFQCCSCRVLTDIPATDVPFRATELPHFREYDGMLADKGM